MCVCVCVCLYSCQSEATKQLTHPQSGVLKKSEDPFCEPIFFKYASCRKCHFIIVISISERCLSLTSIPVTCVFLTHKLTQRSSGFIFWFPTFIFVCALLIFYHYLNRICQLTQHTFPINWANALVGNPLGKWRDHFHHVMTKTRFDLNTSMCVCVCVCVCVSVCLSVCLSRAVWRNSSADFNE